MRILLYIILASSLVSLHVAEGSMPNNPGSPGVEDVFFYEQTAAVARAAEQGNFDKLKKLAREGANLDAQGLDGATPLIWTVVRKSMEGFRGLLELGADPNLVDDRGQSAVMLAAEMGLLSFVKAAIAHGGNVLATGSSGETALILAAPGGETNLVRYLIQQGADVNSSDVDGYTPLMYATLAGQREIVELLLKSGADKLRINNHCLGAIDLTKASHLEQKDRDFIQSQLQITATDIFGSLPLTVAIEAYSASRNPDSLSSFLSSGVNINEVGRGGITPLLWMLLMNDLEGFRIFLNNGANPNLVTDTGSTTVLAAAGVEDPSFLMAVLAKGGNPDFARSSDGTTPLIEAVRGGRAKQIRLLMDAGADLNTGDSIGLTPLHHAVINGKKDAMLLLLNGGADPKRVDKRGLCPRDFANTIGRKNFIMLLQRSE